MRMAGVGQNWSSQGGHRLQWQPMAREGRHWGDDHDSFAQDHMRRFAGRDFDRDDRFRREGRSWDDQGFGFGVGLGVDAGAGLYADGGYDEGSYGGYPAVENDDDQYAPDVTTDEGYGYGGEAYGDDEGRGGGYYDAGNYDAGADASREDRGFGERGRGSWDDERGARSTYDVRACSCGTWRWIPDQGR